MLVHVARNVGEAHNLAEVIHRIRLGGASAQRAEVDQSPARIREGMR